MELLNATITGTEPLLLNNPQTVDPFNKYAKAKSILTSKKVKTDEDHLAIRRIEVVSKVYFEEEDDIGVYVPSTWVSAAIAANSFNIAKVSKAKIRSCVLPTQPKLKLYYEAMDRVHTLDDIADDPFFYQVMLLKQQNVKLAKCAPIFHKWSFDVSLEFDTKIIDRASLVSILDYAANYGGFGDFRPTWGRATLTVNK
jgi:hypothetical protein